MTEKNDPASSEGGRAAEGTGPKRPHATLDLKAVEVKPAGGTKPDPAKDAGAKGAATAADTGGAKPGPDAATAGKGTGAPSDGVPESGAAAAQAGRKSGGPAAQAGRPSLVGRALSHLIAGLAGGVVALFGANWISEQTGLPTPQTHLAKLTDVLDKRVAAIEGQAKDQSIDDANRAAVADLGQRLKALERVSDEVSALREEQSRLSSTTQSLAARLDQPATDPAMADRLQKLEGQLALLAGAADADGNGGQIPQLALLSGKIADLESTLETQIAALRAALPQNVEQQLGSIGEASEAARLGAQRLDRDVAALKGDFARLSQQLETFKADRERLQQAIGAAQEETGRVSSQLGEVKELVQQQSRNFAKPDDVAAAVGPVQAELSGIEKSVATLLTREQDRQINAERIIVSLELGNLKRAIDRGQSFADELAAVERAAGGRLDLSALARLKSSDTPALSELQAGRREAFNAMLDALDQSGEGSVVDRLLAGAKSIVRVRRTDFDANDNSPEAIIARAEAALMQGRLGECLEELRTLPEPVRQAAETWLDKLDARHRIDQAIQSVEAQLKTALTSPASADMTAPAETPPSRE